MWHSVPGMFFDTYFLQENKLNLAISSFVLKYCLLHMQTIMCKRRHCTLFLIANFRSVRDSQEILKIAYVPSIYIWVILKENHGHEIIHLGLLYMSIDFLELTGTVWQIYCIHHGPMFTGYFSTIHFKSQSTLLKIYIKVQHNLRKVSLLPVYLEPKWK